MMITDQHISYRVILKFVKMKYFIVSFALIAAVSAGSTSSSWGTKGPNDKIMLTDRFDGDFSPFRSRLESRRYPSQGEYEHALTYIDCVDNINNGIDRYCKIRRGGPGEHFVVLEVYSPALRGFDYTIDLYVNPNAA